MNRLATTIVLAALLAAAGLRPAHAQQIYVDKDATGAGNGNSWADAYTDLQTAIGNATSSDELWVAEGVYKPNGEGDSFTITGQKDGLEVYGGFDATESTRSERDPTANRTILSGDIGGDDDDPDGDGIIEDASDLRGGENAHHVLVLDGGDGIGPDIGDNVTSSTVLDGLVITAGQADGGSSPDDDGGGLYCDGSRSGNACSPTLANALFAGNEGDRGGAILNNGAFGTSSPSITNATFADNAASNDGGAIFNDGGFGTSSPQVTNATFADNEAEEGGAIYNYGEQGTSSPSVTGATFTGNAASNDGGAIYNYGLGGTSNPQVANTILWGNSASDSGDEILNFDASAKLTHTIIEGGVGSSDDDGGNLDADPLFVDAATPTGADGTYATKDDGVNVAAGSPALDEGTNDTVSVSTDITGAARIQDLDGDGTARVNIGAYEAEEPARTIHVDADANGAGDGTSWADAYTDLQAALDANVTTANDEIWIAEGVYTPGSEGESFTIPGQKDGLKVYGGFESGDAFADRDPDAHPTVLSGDVGGDDNTDADGVTPTAGDIDGDNADHVLVLNAGTGLGSNVGLNITTRTVIDGVIVTAGQADGSFPNNQGGGLYCDGASSGNECSPTLRAVVFAGNASGESGAAVYADGGGGGTVNLAAQRSVFASNAAGGSGGGIAAEGEAAAVSVTSSLFVDNDGATGGGAINVRIGGSGPVQPQIVNSTFVDNTASGGGSNTRGGALSFFANTGTLEPTVANAILWGNTAPSGNQIGSNAGSGALTLTVGHSIVEGGESGIAEVNGAQTTYASSNLDQDPEFRDRGAPAGPDGTLATADDGLNVTPGSPAPDAGDNGEIPSGVTDDITGADRTQDQNGSGTATVNLGAYEQIPPSPPVASGTAVQNVTGTSAEVTGTANAGGLETAVQVRYFPTADPSDLTTATAPSSPIVDGNFADQDVTVSLDGLSPDTEYKARLVASNNEGLVDGGTVSFTTDAGYARTISGTDGTQNDAGWRMLALPAADEDRSALEDDLEFSVNSGSILYRWTSGSWTDWTDQTASGDNLPRGRGFMLYFFDDVIDPIDAEGLPLAVGTGPEDQSTDHQVSSLSTGETFHLLGNPFDVAFDLSELNLPEQGFQQTVQIWDPSSDSYTQVTQSGDQSDVVGAWQGFFVERDPGASTDGTSLTFSTAGKQSGPGTIIGSQSASLADTKRGNEKRLRLGLRLAVLDTTSGDTAPPSPKADAAAPSRPVPDSLTAEAAAQSSNQSSDGAQAAEAEADTVGTGRLGLLLSSEATGGWDAYEASQLGPPGGGHAVALSSPLEREGKQNPIQRALASEPYPTGSSGESASVTVSVSVNANVDGGQATLRLPDAQRKAIPSGWALRLTDTRAGEQVDLLTEAYRFTLDETGEAGGTAPPESRFRLAVGPQGALPTPDGLALEAPYPNPTTRSVTVEYAVPQDKADGAQLQLYDVLGRRVRTVSVKPGPHAQRLDVSGLASGVYVLRLTAEGAQQTRKLTVVR